MKPFTNWQSQGNSAANDGFAIRSSRGFESTLLCPPNLTMLAQSFYKDIWGHLSVSHVLDTRFWWGIRTTFEAADFRIPSENIPIWLSLYAMRWNLDCHKKAHNRMRTWCQVFVATAKDVKQCEKKGYWRVSWKIKTWEIWSIRAFVMWWFVLLRQMACVYISGLSSFLLDVRFQRHIVWCRTSTTSEKLLTHHQPQ